MADGKIVMNNFNAGMTNDSYSGGFVYGENVDIRQDPKAVKIAAPLSLTEINNRQQGFANAFSDAWSISDFGPFMFSADGHIESGFYSDNFGIPQGGTSGGALFRRPSTAGYWTGGMYQKSLFGIANNKIDRLLLANSNYGAGIWSNELVTNPGFTTGSMSGWTAGAGWANPNNNGAIHTPGNTADLSQTVSMSDGRYVRIIVRVEEATAGSITVKRNSTTLGTLDVIGDFINERTYTFTTTGTSGTDSIVITPSSNFNGKITYIGAREYTTDLKYEEITLTASSSAQGRSTWFIDGGRLYVGFGHIVNIIDITSDSTWVLDSTLVLEQGDEVIKITKIGETFNIYVNKKGISGIAYAGMQYFWNGVDSVPAEKMLWKAKTFQNVENDGNIDHVIAETIRDKPEYYRVSGFERAPVFLSHSPLNNLLRERREAIDNKFNFNAFLNGMAMYKGLLYVSSFSGIYCIGDTRGGSPKAVKVYGPRRGSTSDFGDMMEVRPIYFYRNSVYTSFRDNVGAGKYINYIAAVTVGFDRASSGTQGYIITPRIQWDKYSSLKTIDKFKLGYNLRHPNNKINVYVNVYDRYFWTFYVTGVNTIPEKGCVYSMGGGPNSFFEVLSTEITNGTGTITCKGLSGNNFNGVAPSNTLVKESGTGGLPPKTGQDTISTHDIDNFAKMFVFEDGVTNIYNIYNNGKKKKESTVVANNILGLDMPNRDKIQLKIELIRGSTSNGGGISPSPELYDLSLLATVVEKDDI